MGLGDTIAEMPLRAYAEAWCREQEAENRERRERLETARHRSTRGIAVLALLISLASATFTIWRSSK
jgi:GTP cyclohydrolase III